MSLDQILEFLFSRRNVEDYFPFIHHNLDSGKDSMDLDSLRGKVFSEKSGLIYSGPNKMFSSIKVDVPDSIFEIAQDPKSVMFLLPRHKSLYDYLVGQPVHHDLIHQRLMIMGGDNLYRFKFSPALKNKGGFVFVRQNILLTLLGHFPAFISVKKYTEEIFPEYMKWQMVDEGFDMMCFLGQKKVKGGVRETGRTKSGELRQLGSLFFKPFGDLVKEYGSEMNFYAVPINYSFSKYPDAPYIVHDDDIKTAIFKFEKYFWQQRFVFETYPEYANKHSDAKLDVAVRYGEPVLMNDYDLSNVGESMKFSREMTSRIGSLEAIFPLTFLYRAMEGKDFVRVDDLFDRLDSLFEYYSNLGIDVSAISKSSGELMDKVDLVSGAVEHINSNPFYHMRTIKHANFLREGFRSIKSDDLKLQNWYVNLVKHLD